MGYRAYRRSKDYYSPYKAEFKEKLTQSFKDLRKLGYFARQNFWCCQSCAWSDVPEEKEDKVVFYHRQDNKSVPDGRVMLAWAGDGNEIVEVMKKYFVVEWDGSEHSRILVKLNKWI